MPEVQEGYDILLKQFSRRLTEAVQRSDLTRTAICQRIGTAPPRLSEWENGKVLPSAYSLLRLAEVLDCNLDWLLVGRGTIYDRPVEDDQARLELVKLVVNHQIKTPTVEGIRRQLDRARALQSLVEEKEQSPTPESAPDAPHGDTKAG